MNYTSDMAEAALHKSKINDINIKHQREVQVYKDLSIEIIERINSLVTENRILRSKLANRDTELDKCQVSLVKIIDKVESKEYIEKNRRSNKARWLLEMKRKGYLNMKTSDIADVCFLGVRSVQLIAAES